MGSANLNDFRKAMNRTRNRSLPDTDDRMRGAPPRSSISNSILYDEIEKLSRVNIAKNVCQMGHPPSPGG